MCTCKNPDPKIHSNICYKKSLAAARAVINMVIDHGPMPSWDEEQWDTFDELMEIVDQIRKPIK